MSHTKFPGKLCTELCVNGSWEQAVPESWGGWQAAGDLCRVKGPKFLLCLKHTETMLPCDSVC